MSLVQTRQPSDLRHLGAPTWPEWRHLHASAVASIDAYIVSLLFALSVCENIAHERGISIRWYFSFSFGLTVHLKQPYNDVNNNRNKPSNKNKQNNNSILQSFWLEAKRRISIMTGRRRRLDPRPSLAHPLCPYEWMNETWPLGARQCPA